MSDWMPVHHEESDEESGQPNDPRPRDEKPRDTKAKPADTTIPLSLTMSIPPELIAALSSLAGTMERIATQVAAQGKAIQALAEAISTQEP